MMNYLKCPNADTFLKLVTQKSHEIDEQIKRLKKLKAIMSEKQKALALCEDVYDGMIDYAAAKNLELKGDCYEMGLNEFAISSEEEYVTRIEIQC